MSRWLVLSLLGACGRFGFDATVENDAPDATGDESYRSAVLSDRPIGYWRLGDLPRVADEMGGPDAVASTGCTLGDSLLAGDPDRSVTFDGTCYLDAGSGFAFLGLSPFTVEAWISSDVDSSYQHIVTRQLRDAADPIEGYSLLDSPTGVYFERVVANMNRTTQRQVTVRAQTVHLVGTYDGALLTLYLGGAPIGPGNSSATVASTYPANLLIGTSQGPTSLLNSFRGRIDEVAIYDHVLPAERIRRHHDIGTSGP